MNGVGKGTRDLCGDGRVIHVTMPVLATWVCTPVILISCRLKTVLFICVDFIKVNNAKKKKWFSFEVGHIDEYNTNLYKERNGAGGKAACKIKPGRKLIRHARNKHLMEESYRLGSELLRSQNKQRKRNIYKLSHVHKRKFSVFVK